VLRASLYIYLWGQNYSNEREKGENAVWDYLDQGVVEATNSVDGILETPNISESFKRFF
jgi:hypothetical protein